MANSVKSTPEELTVHPRPLQVIPEGEKTEKWYKANIREKIGKAQFDVDGTGKKHGRKNLHTLYGVYNNQFPLEWFKHITDPLSATKKEHKAYPAKIRPTTILRTNIDLLLGEYPRRPFIYNVSNLGDSGYSRYMEAMKGQAQANLTQIFLQEYLAEAQASGRQLTPEELQQLEQQPPVPEEVKKEFAGTYRDKIAEKAQRYLRKVINSERLRSKFHKLFKDWLIAGEAYSYKSVENGKIVYRRIDAMELDYSKSEENEYIEDGEWVVSRRWLTLSDIVDEFYMVLEEQHLKDLEKYPQYRSSQSFFNYIQSNYSGTNGRYPVHHVQWKGKKKIGFLTYLDMETFQMVEEVVDESYVVDRSRGEQVEWRWVNEVYEGWQIAKDIYCNMQACPIQRNELNNFSTCKLSYNGKRYSDTNSQNLSVLEIGIPFQIMYIITNYTLEKTIAKSKGKIVMMDQATIPKGDGWDEEKFFYYADALGYAMLNRNQIGVDKTWNQYQVLDLSLFDQIKQLIEIMDWIKQQWDDVIGISRQRKGQTYASDGVGSNERSVFQSTVITDMIFLGFDEFVQTELQGILDLSKYTTANGEYSIYNDDEYGTQVLEILPEDFSFEDLGIMMVDASEELRKLGEAKQYAQAMMQNGYKASTVLEVIDSINISELKNKLKAVEAIQQEIDEQMAETEEQMAAAADARKKDMMEYAELLKRGTQAEKHEQDMDKEMLKGTFNTFTFQDGDANDNGTPDAMEVAGMMDTQFKTKTMYEDMLAKQSAKNSELALKQKELDHKIKTDNYKLKQGDKKLKIDAKKAAQRPKTSKK